MITERETFISLIDNDILKPSDAIVLLEGDGLNRYQKAVELFHLGISNKIVFSGGITNYEYGSYPFSDVLPHLLEAEVPQNAIIHEDKSLNTREQAVEVVKMATKNQWGRLILIASCEHQYRAYLTFLREIIDTNSGIILYNVPAQNKGWFKPTNWGICFDRLKQEFDRIEKYTLSGHLASYKEAIDYQQWKEQR
jgi:uncharacterized SAM-binding protein YcdF (DUF218 family)